MKNTYTFLLLLFLTYTGVAQIIYQDNFESDNGNISETTGLSSNVNAGIFTITGNGSAGNYSAVKYTVLSSGGTSTIDFSDAPRIFIKARASKNVTLRLDLVDNNDFITNQNPASLNLTTQYKIHEFLYLDRFRDGGFSEPCQNGGQSGINKCVVDSKNIEELLFLIDSGDSNSPFGKFNGTVDIDWISVGSPVEPLNIPEVFEIRYNQISYFKGRKKYISLVNTIPFAGKSYTVKNSSGTTVLSGTSQNSSLWFDANAYAATVDISSIDDIGTYTFTSNNQTVNFKISDDGYKDLSKATFKYYYFNRASSPVTPALGGAYARAAGHPDNNITVHSSAASPGRPTGSKISSPKGWYDAGDYNKYIVNSGISTYTLLAAYEHYADYYDEQAFEIPEQGNNLPDILDEIIWNLDWMLTMQDPHDGGVYHKLTAKRFSGAIMPKDYNLERFVVEKSTSAALNLAAVAAVASRIFANFQTEKPGYSAQLLQAAKDAYAWAKANPTVFYTQTPGFATGQYQDSDVDDEFQWAATELFITTQETTYSNDIDAALISGGIPAWQYVSPLALISIAHHESNLSGFNTAAAKNTLIASADTLKIAIETSPMNIAMSSKNENYVWGSNGVAGNQVMILIRAYEATKDNSYLSAAYTAMDYLLGRNGTGYCYITGYGDRTVTDSHHRPSEADGIQAPVPGMVAGGPNPGQQDRANCPNNSYPSIYPASSYVDKQCSYASNEVTINWNAPTVYAINALHYYQTKSGTLSNQNSNDLKKIGIQIYPNPSNGLLNISFSKDNLESYDVTVFTLQGKKALQTSISNNTILDITSLTHGQYLIQFTNSQKQSFVSKIIRYNK